MVGEDGGIFNFSDKPFAGSLGGQTLPAPIVSVAVPRLANVAPGLQPTGRRILLTARLAMLTRPMPVTVDAGRRLVQTALPTDGKSSCSYGEAAAISKTHRLRPLPLRERW